MQTRTAVFLAALALALATPAATAQDGPTTPAAATNPRPDLFPGTPAGEAARAWFDAVRSGQRERVEAMINDRFDPLFLASVPYSQHLTMHMRLADAGLSLPHSVSSQTDHRITYYLRDGGVWGQLRIEVSDALPHGITMVAVRPSQGPPEMQGRPKTLAAFKSETVEFLEALHDNGRLDGAVLVASIDGIQPDAGLAWMSPDFSRDMPIDFVLDAIKLAVPLSVVHRSHEQRHPPEEAIASSPSASRLERRIITDEHEIASSGKPKHELKIASDRARRERHAVYKELVETIFPSDSPAQLEYQRGLVNALVFEPLWMIDCEAPFGTEGRMNPADLVRFGRGLLDPEYIRPRLLEDVTTGAGRDLDRSPRIVRRTALGGFEERIDEGGVRSFSLQGASERAHVMLRCYPDPRVVVVVVAPDEKTLNLIDRRIFNRLPGLEPGGDDPADQGP